MNKYTCTKCGKEKTKEEMSKDARRNGGISSWCKICRRVSSRSWGTKNPDLVIEQRKRRKENPMDYATQRDYMLRHRYGISQLEYDNMLKTQSYKCAICGRDSKDSSYLLHVDHNHTTGEVRGLLCSPCNVYLGYIKDSKEILQKGIDYL